ncbi:MAG: CBS domain-containing protein [Phycisphaeraceae bacterium]|nr:CBS domain-containing protein [Phycisphaeraceae bacterium]
MGLRTDILNQPVADLPLRPLVSVPTGTRVRQAMVKMREAKLGCAVVVDAEGRPLGKFTERRLMSALLQSSRNLDAPVDLFMFGQDDCVTESDPIIRMIEKMDSRKLRFVVVVDAQGKAIALTGQKGVMEFVADHFPRHVKVQEMHAKLHMDEREGA